MSEWLGTGLQNRSHQFESGWNLKINSDFGRNLSFIGLISKSCIAVQVRDSLSKNPNNCENIQVIANIIQADEFRW